MHNFRGKTLKHYYDENGFMTEYPHEDKDLAEISHIVNCECKRLREEHGSNFDPICAGITDYAFAVHRSLYGVIITFEADISLGKLSGFVRENEPAATRLWFGILDRWYGENMVPREFMLYAHDLLMRAAINTLVGETKEDKEECQLESA